MNAREQAERCAQAQSPDPAARRLLADGAEAASDVWEPLLLDLVSAIDQQAHQHNWLIHTTEYRRAKEALNGTP